MQRVSLRGLRPRGRRPAFSLVELVVVVVILGLLAALAIPRLGQADESDPEGELAQRLVVLRLAIEMYRDDHGAYPGQASHAAPADSASVASISAPPTPVPATATAEELLVRQLTGTTDASGAVGARDAAFRFGPYLRSGVPRNPLVRGAAADRIHVLTGEAIPAFRGDAAAGWIYNADTGFIAANLDGTDSRGRRFDQY